MVFWHFFASLRLCVFALKKFPQIRKSLMNKFVKSGLPMGCVWSLTRPPSTIRGDRRGWSSTPHPTEARSAYFWFFSFNPLFGSTLIPNGGLVILFRSMTQIVIVIRHVALEFCLHLPGPPFCVSKLLRCKSIVWIFGLPVSEIRYTQLALQPMFQTIS